MKAFLSHYRPRYVRALVYMLQSTEYQLSYFWKWFGRTKDFSNLEQRSRLEKTPKSWVLLILGWIIVALYWLASIIAVHGLSPHMYPLALALVFFATPYILVLVITFPVWAIGYLQKLYERRLIKQARQILLHNPAARIGIAGSYGKTSMRYILTAILSEGRRAATPQHNYNTPIGISRFVASLSGDEEILVFELGEYYPGDVRRLCNMVMPGIGVITGVNEAHLERFNSLDKTAATIFELADWLGKKPVYVNAESDLAKAQADKRHELYSHGGCGETNISHVEIGLSGTKFKIELNGKVCAVKTQLLGRHNLGPIAAAATIALSLGLTPEQIVAGIAKTKPFEHRLEPSERGDVTYIDDSYNGNPDGVHAAINFLASIKNRRRFYVTPGLVEMGPRTHEVHQEIGRWLAESGIEQVVLVRNSATEVIAKGLETHGFKGKLTWFERAEEVFAALPNLTVSDDVVLLQNDWPDQYS